MSNRLNITSISLIFSVKSIAPVSFKPIIEDFCP